MRQRRLGAWGMWFAVLALVMACGGGGGERRDIAGEDALDWGGDADAGADVQTPDVPVDVPVDGASEIDVPSDLPGDVPVEILPDVPIDVPIDAPADVPTDGPVDVPSEVSSQVPLAGDLVVTEFMAKSQGGTDQGEWVELTNVTDRVLELGGCVLADDSSEAHTIEGSLLVGPGAVVLLAKSGDPLLNHGLTPDYVYAGFTLSNGGDEIVLRCPAAGGDVPIDRVGYTSDQIDTGVALQLDPASTDAAANDDPSAWCAATTSYAAGVYGTPGAANPSCGGGATVGWCRLQAPLDLTVGAGITFQAYGHVFVAGVTDASAGVDGHPLLVGQAGFGADGSDPTAAGWTWFAAGPNADWNDATAGELGNDEYQAKIVAPSAGTYDLAFRFSFDGGTSWTVCDGAAGMGHDGSEDGYSPANAGNLVAEPSPCDPNPCTAAPAAACDVDGVTVLTYASPGACAIVDAAAACTYPATELDCSENGQWCEDGACMQPPQAPAPSAPGDVLVTEFMAKSQGGTDNGEWVEIWNATDQALDLGGCVLHDTTTDSHAIVGPLPIAPGGFLVLAKSAVAAENHGAEPDYVYKSFSLKNGADQIILSCGDVEIDAVAYGDTWYAQGAATQLDPAAFDVEANDLAASWCLAKTPFGSDGLFGTPGAPNANCASPKVGWCRFQHPLATTVGLNEPVATYGRVFAEGVTDLTTGTDVTAALVGAVGVGPDGTQPAGNAAWTWTTAAANVDWVDTLEPGNDEYTASLSVAAVGAYDLAYRFSLDGGASWTYCDGPAGAGKDGSEDGYDPANAGALVAKSALCDPNPCVAAPPAACQDGTTLITHASPGTCQLVDGFAECSYPEVTVDCALDAKVCVDGACAYEGTGTMPAAAGDLVITEFMPRSQSGSGDPGEWVELTNTTAGLLDLAGCVLKDDGSDSFTITSALLVPAGRSVVLAASLDPAKNHGLEADRAWTNFSLTNGADDAIILTCGEVVIDRVGYTPAWVVLATAMQLSASKISATANDVFENWCLATSGYGTDVPPLLGTPGEANALCTQTIVDWCRLQHPLDLTIDAGTTESYYARVNVGGLTDLTDGVDPSEVLKGEIGFGPDGSSPDANADWTWFVAAGTPGWDAAAAGEPGNDEYTAAVSVALPGTYDTAARFSFDGGATWVYCDGPAGAGKDGSEDGYSPADAGALTANATPCAPNPCTDPPAASCDDTFLVVPATVGVCTLVDAAPSCAYPETRTDCTDSGKICVDAVCVLAGEGRHPVAGQVVVNEFMARSQAGTDDGEWIELLNVGTENVDVGGCVLKDAGSDSHTVAGVLIAVPGKPLLLARSGDPVKNSGLEPDYVYANFTLANTADAIELVCDAVSIDQVAYTAEWVVLGASTQLKPEATTALDNDDLANWCFGRPAYGDAVPRKLGTPGTANHTCDPLQVGWCRIQHPMTASVDVEFPTTTYGRVQIPWITERTDGVDEDENIVAQMGYGPDGSTPVDNADWTWLVAAPNPGWDAAIAGEPGNDEYQADVALAVPGLYDLAYRFSADGGATWVYCDGAAGFGADGSEDGYSPDNAGSLQVNATVCNPNPCTAVPLPVCEEQVLRTYVGPGACTDVAGSSECAYESSTVDCAALDKICDATTLGACIVPGQGNTPKVAGDLLITEFMAKSQAGDDPGEWFELTNTTGAILDLGGCVVKDDDQNLHTVAGVHTIQPGSRLVLAKSANVVLNHGLVPDYVYANFTLGNSSDVIEVVCDGVVIDRVAYASTWIVEGAATQLSLLAFDPAANDDRGAWCTAWTVYGTDGKLGTPGVPNPACDPCQPNPCDDPPLAACDGTATKVLSYPATGTCSVVDHAAACAYPPAVTDCDAQLLVCLDGACVPSGDPCVPNPCRVAPVPTCDADGVTLRSYTAPGACQNVADAAQCDFPSTATVCSDTAGYVCAGGACVLAGLGNTPDMVGDVIVTEFMARSMAGTDTGEWVEILNTTGESLDLGGCLLNDDGTDHHAFAAPLIIGAGKRLLLAKSGDPALNKGLTPHYVYSGFDLSNSGDQIVLTCGATEIDRVVYTAAWVVLGSAIGLDPASSTAAANDLLDNWCLATVPYGTSLLYGTPGLPNPPCPNPCDPNPCTEPPAPECFLGGPILFSYVSPAACTVVNDAAVCGAYTLDMIDCAASGLACVDGACVEPPPPMPTVAGQVVVTEFMAKSQAADDPGEWIEVTNVTTGTLDLAGCVLRDNHSSEHHAIVGDLLMAAGQSLVLARSGDPVENHGVAFDYVYSNFFLSNTADEIVLECGALVIDQVAYTSDQAITGVAAQLAPDMLDAVANDAPENWCGATMAYGTDGLLGTPRLPNTACIAPVDPCQPNPCTTPPAAACLDADTVIAYSAPAACSNDGGLAVCGPYPSLTTACGVGQICQGGACVEGGAAQPSAAGDFIVTEFMAKSQANADPGEWVELYNATLGTLDLAGCVLRDEGSDLHTIAASVEVPLGGHVVLAKNGDPQVNHGLSPDYVYAGFTLSNTDDEILLECGGVVIDRVAYLAGQAQTGVASQLSLAVYDAVGNDTASNWCPATAVYGTTGELGTPGALNGSCGMPVDPCVPNPCVSAPAPACLPDGLTLISYQAPAPCTTDAGSAVCGVFPSTVTDCALDGQVCLDGACVTIFDPCQPNPCTTPPAAACLADGVTRVTYAAEAACTAVGADALCSDYAASSYDCSIEDKVCLSGQCVPAGPRMPTAEGQVIVTEFMARSVSGTDNFEWVELTNTTDQTFDLGACLLTDDNTNTHVLTGPLLIGPHAPLLLVRTASDTEYGHAPDYVYGASFSLGNTGDKIILRCDGLTIDGVTYVSSWVVLGKALQLSTTAFDATLNDDVSHWCAARDEYNPTPKYGTPGTANFDCAAP